MSERPPLTTEQIKALFEKGKRDRERVAHAWGVSKGLPPPKEKP